MAKKSSVQKDLRRRRTNEQQLSKRSALKAVVMDKSKSMEERFAAQLKLNELSPDGSKVRLRNRCEVSGRPRGTYRKFRMSRIALRELGNFGQIPGLIKSSW
jgi:small subunit ribosomal protein S14